MLSLHQRKQMRFGEFNQLGRETGPLGLVRGEAD